MLRKLSSMRSRNYSSRIVWAASVAAMGLIGRQQIASGAPAPASWTGAGSTAFWSDSGNWSSSAGYDDPPVNGDDLQYTGNSPTTTVNANSSTTGNYLTSVNSINFSGAGYILNAYDNTAALTVGAGGITNNIGYTQTINEDLYVNTSQTWNAGLFGVPMVYGNVSLGSGTPTLTMLGNGAQSIGGGVLLPSGNATVANAGSAYVYIGTAGTTGFSGTSTSTLTLDSSGTTGGSPGFYLQGNPTFAGTIDLTNSGASGVQDVLNGTSPFPGTVLVDMGSGSAAINNVNALGSSSTVVLNTGYFAGKTGASIGTLSISNNGGYFTPNGNVTVTQLLTTGGSINNGNYAISGSGATNSIVSIAGGSTFSIHNADYFSGTFAEGVVVNGIHFAYYSTANSNYTGGMTLTGHGAAFNWGSGAGGTGAFGSLTGAGTFLTGATPTDTNPVMNFASLSAGGIYATSPNQVYSGFASINPGNGTFVFSSGSTLLPGYNGTTGTLKFSSSTGFLSMQGGSTLNMNLTGTPSQVSDAGGFTWSTSDSLTPSSSNMEILSVTGATVGTYDLIAYASLTGGAAVGMDVTSDFDILGLTGGDTGDLSLQANDLQLIVSAPVPEPMGLAILGLGAVGLLGRRRKRRNDLKAVPDGAHIG